MFAINFSAWFRCALVTLATWMGSAIALAQEPAAVPSTPAIEIAKLLEVGWSSTLSAKTAADEQYKVVVQIADGDRRATQAMMLVTMQQRRYDNSLQLADSLMAADKTDMMAARAKVWLSALLKNYSASMVAAENLADQLVLAVSASKEPTDTENPATDELSVESRSIAETVSFLGRMYGFFGGPGAAAINLEARKTSEKRVIDKLPEHLRETFAIARDTVLQRHLEMSDEKAEVGDAARAEETMQKEKTLEQIERDRQLLAERVSALREQRNRLSQELRETLAAIAQEDVPLASQLARLEASAALISRDLANYQNDIDRLDLLLRRERDPIVRQAIRRDIDRISFQASRLDNEYRLLDREASVVQGQRSALLAKSRDVQASFGGQINSIDKDLTAASKQEKKADVMEREARKPASSTTKRTLALGATASALTTYETFPLEEAKASLLESLK